MAFPDDWQHWANTFPARVARAWYDFLTAIVNPDAISVGDGTNDVDISDEGIFLIGTATMWDDLRFPVSAQRVGGAGAPGWTNFLDNGSGSTGVGTYWFDPNSEEQLYFIAQFPHDWLEGSGLEFHVHWTPENTAGVAGTDVCWGLEYTWANINAVFGNTTLIYGDEQTIGPTETLTEDKHYITELGTIDGTGKTMSSIMLCRLFRDATSVGGVDNYPDDAGLLFVDFHYERNSLGSKEEYVKGP